MSDVLFTHSYFLKLDPKEHKAMMPYAPLGTLYAASVLRAQGYACTLSDSMLSENEQEILLHIQNDSPKIVVIYDDDFNYLTKMCLRRMRQAAFTITRIAKEHGCTVVVHSSDSTDNVEEYLERGADFVIVGEGEFTLAELTNQLLRSQQQSWRSINGLAYREDGSIQRNPKRDVLHDLDTLPFPAWDLVSVENYRHVWKKRHKYFSMNIVTTRGCPFHCNWCAKPIYGQVYHSHSPEYIAEEMEMLKRDYKPDHLWFCDDIFGLKPGWVPTFADVLLRKRASIPFKCLSRADLLLKEETIRHLARAGCQTVWIGAESGSQRVLDAMEKGTTIEQIYSSTKLLHENGIRVGFFLQYGYPGETRHDIEMTQRMVRDCKPDEIGISVSYPLPGTKFYERVKQDLGEKRNWVDSQDLDMMYHSTYSTEFYRALHQATHKKFRIWQGIDLAKSVLADPSTMNRPALRRIAATAYHALTLPTVETRMKFLARHSNGSKGNNSSII
ncbi:MAG: B12-binding domain-containing radical SAM protein [Ignavibacteria bacterium]|nr:B12-binding domain-containing radical SAM protein [Ignavibacteria bacterium]